MVLNKIHAVVRAKNGNMKEDKKDHQRFFELIYARAVKKINKSQNLYSWLCLISLKFKKFNTPFSPALGPIPLL